MKITKKQLIQIIKEELEAVVETVYAGQGVWTWKVTLGGQVVAATKKEYNGTALPGPQTLIDFLSTIEDVSTLEQHSVAFNDPRGGAYSKNGVVAKAYAEEDLSTRGNRPKNPRNVGYDGSDMSRPNFNPRDWD